MEKKVKGLLVLGGVGLLLSLVIYHSVKASGSNKKTVSGKYRTRGMNLNNPGCLRHSKKKKKSNWIGKSNNQPDKDFVKFDSMYHGVRANLINLRNGYINQGLTRIDAIMNKYAPPKENHTSVYADFLKQRVGDVRIDKNNIAKLAFFIFQYETDHEFGNYFSISDIQAVINKERIF